MNAPLTTAGAAMIPLDGILVEENAQTRVKMRAAMVREYAAAMKQQHADGGLCFPPVIVFSDGASYWLADGFHRVAAARKVGLAEIVADIRPGTERDALLYAISANGEHGLPRSRADRRKAVAILLNDEEWRQWSDREIARRCQVSNNMVSRMRRSGASVLEAQMRPRKVERQGVIYEMNPKTTTATNTDALGLPLSDAKASAFADCDDFQAARDLFGRLSALLERIAQSPAGAAYRGSLYRTIDNGQVRFACPALRVSRNNLVAAEPYCAYCPVCHSKNPERPHPDCPKCGGRGWTTRGAFEGCGAREKEAILRMKNG